MATDFDQLLDATIQHLERMRSSGVRHVVVPPETLSALVKPAPSAAVAPAPNAATELSGESAQPAMSASVTVASAELPSRSATESKIQNPAPTSRERESKTEKSAAFADLRQRAMACVKCSHLASSRKNVVFGVGNPDADLMFVGEAPGADEDEQGEPFVGKAGQLLTKIIETMGLDRGDVYIANILKCRPDTPGQTAGNRKPTPEEMQTCIPFLHEQIDLIRPKVLVALGGTAMEGLLNKTGITKLRGHWHSYRGIPLMPTYHPSYLLRNQALHEKRKVWEDMLQVMDKLRMPISEKQQKFFLKV
jgi:uracil-DNA glycosylase